VYLSLLGWERNTGGKREGDKGIGEWRNRDEEIALTRRGKRNAERIAEMNVKPIREKGRT
jgi:hypothetical protein